LLAQPATARQAEWPRRVIRLAFHRLEQVVQSRRPALGFDALGFVYDVYAKYAAFLGQPVMPADRLEAYLADDPKRESYLQDPFPDADFGRTLLQAVREGSEMKRFDLARRLKDCALRGMGGFDPREMAG
jgi:hypothetical protein